MLTELNISLSQESWNKGRNFTLSVDDFGHRGNFDYRGHYEACKYFPWYWMQTYLNVRDKSGRLVPMKLFRTQKYAEKILMEQWERYGYSHEIALKARQLGKSYHSARRGLHASIFYNHAFRIYTSTKQNIGQFNILIYVLEALNGLKEYYGANRFPEWLGDLTEIKSRKESLAHIELANGGCIEVVPADKNAVSKTVQFAHVSEAPRIERYDEFHHSFYPGLPKHTYHQFICESTALWSGTFFLDAWFEQWQREQLDGYPPVLRATFYPPYMHEEYLNQPLPKGYDLNVFWDKADIDLYGDEAELMNREWYDPLDEKNVKLPLNFWYWRRITIDGINLGGQGQFNKLQLFRQDYPMYPEEASLVAGDSPFDKELLNKRKFYPYTIKPAVGDIGFVKLVGDKPEFFGDTQKGRLWIWLPPQKGNWYTIGADPASDKKGDFSVASVWSPRDNAIAARLRHEQYDIHQFVEDLIALAMYYNWAMIAYEAGFYGDIMLKKFLGTDRVNPVGAPYKNLYKRRPTERAYNRLDKNPTYGFHSDTKRKMAIVGIFQDLIRDNKSGLWSENLITEMLGLRQIADKDGNITKTPSAPKGRHDDEYDSVGIAIYAALDYVKRFDLQREIEFKMNNGKVITPKEQIAAKPFAVHSGTTREKREQWEEELEQISAQWGDA